MAKKKKPAKAAVTPQTQIRRLKKTIKWLEWDNACLRKCVQEWYKEQMSLEELLAWEKKEIAPLLEDPDALAAALKGPKLLDIVKDFKRQKRLRKKGA